MHILLVDDHTLFREAVLHVLRQFDERAVVIEAAAAEEALRLATHYQELDLILLDLAMPGARGLSALLQLRAARPTVPLVVLSASEAPADVRQALAAGAAGYIPKSSSIHTLISALRLIMAGEVYLPSHLLVSLAAPFEQPPAEDAAKQPPDSGELTPRQRQVLRLMGEGLSNKMIARRLNLAEGTVKLHVAAILRALDTDSRVQAVLEAVRQGLLSAPTELAAG